MHACMYILQNIVPIYSNDAKYIKTRGTKMRKRGGAEGGKVSIAFIMVVDDNTGVLVQLSAVVLIKMRKIPI